MGIEYKITDLLAAAFDIKMPIRIPDPVAIAKGKLGQQYTVSDDKQELAGIYYPNIIMKEPDAKSVSVSWMGTPILFPFTFLNEGMDKPYTRYKKNGELEVVIMEKFELPAATVIDFSRAKNIIKTDMLGGSGTVKELFGFDDWRIRIRGICLDDSNRQTAKKAHQQKEQLLRWEQICGSIKVEGELLNEKGIDEIVIESISFRQLEGKPGVMPFEIQASSNEPINLVL